MRFFLSPLRQIDKKKKNHINLGSKEARNQGIMWYRQLVGIGALGTWG